MNAPVLANHRILVVEDNRDTANWICETLRSAFSSVQYASASSIAEAEGLLFGRSEHRRTFDLALIDIGLPDGNGIELVRKISGRLPSTLPVVITVLDDDATLFEALSAGAMGYILKGVNTTSLVEQLRRIDRHEPPISPQIAHRILAYFQAASADVRPGQGTASESHLTNREVEVLGLLGKGLTAAEIATILGVTQNTCATHIKTIYRKLNISSRAEAALEADRRGLL